MKNQETTEDSRLDLNKRKWFYSEQNNAYSNYSDDPSAKKCTTANGSGGGNYDYENYQPNHQLSPANVVGLNGMEMSENIEYVNILYDENLLSGVQAAQAADPNYINFEPNWNNADILDLDQRNYYYETTVVPNVIELNDQHQRQGEQMCQVSNVVHHQEQYSEAAMQSQQNLYIESHEQREIAAPAVAPLRKFDCIFFCFVADGSTNVCFESMQSTHFDLVGVAAVRWWHGFVLFSMNADFYWFNGTDGIILQHKKNTSDDDKQTFNTRFRKHNSIRRSFAFECSKREQSSLFNVCMATRSFPLHRFLFLFHVFLSIYSVHSWHFIEKLLIGVLVTCYRGYQTISLLNFIRLAVFRRGDGMRIDAATFSFLEYFENKTKEINSNFPAPQQDDSEDKSLSWLYNFKLNELPHLSPEVNRARTETGLQVDKIIQEATSTEIDENATVPIELNVQDIAPKL